VIFRPDATMRLLHIARAAIRAKLEGRPSVPPQADPSDPADICAELNQPAGCFVSLHELDTHRLRGCVGRLDASGAVCLAVHQAAESVLDDPRFAADPVTAAELADLELEVSVLSPLRAVDSPLAFEPAEHGIYLHLGGRTGCFLPQVARETGWTREQLLDRLCIEKLGVDACAWQTEDARMYVFSVLVIGPEPFVVSPMRVQR
jgi:uncharacterized protein